MKKITPSQLFTWLVYGSLFLLPWQTRYIYGQSTIAGTPFDFGVMSIYAVQIIIAIAFFVGQRMNIRKDHQLSVRAIGVVLLATAASIPLSHDVNLSLSAWSMLLFSGLLFACLLDQRVQTWTAMRCFVAGLIIPSVLGLVQFFSGSSPASKWLGLAVHHASDLGAAVIAENGERLLRAYGTFPHPNIFGGYLAIGLLCAFMLAMRAKKQTEQILSRVVLVLFSFALVSTFSRSAWLALAGAGIAALFLLVLKRREAIKRGLPTVGLVFLSLFIAAAAFVAPLESRFNLSLPLELQSVDQRVNQYQAFPRVLNGSMMTGVGIGAYTVALADVMPGESVFAYQPIHNTPLLVFAETGILGVIAVFLWAASVDRVNYVAIARKSIPAIGGIALGTVPLVVIFFDHYIWSSWAGLALLAFLMAMTLRLSE